MYTDEIAKEIKIISKKYDHSRKTINIGTLIVLAPFSICFFIFLFNHNWVILLSGLLLSIFFYIPFLITGQADKVNEIEQEVKLKIIKKKLLNLFPSGSFYLMNHEHKEIEIKSSLIFDDLVKINNKKPKSAFYNRTQDYNLKISEIKISDLPKSLFLTVHFKNIRLDESIFIKPKNFKVRKYRSRSKYDTDTNHHKTKNYTLYFKSVVNPNRSNSSKESNIEIRNQLKALFNSIQDILNQSTYHPTNFLIITFVNDTLNIFILKKSFFNLKTDKNMTRQNYANDVYDILSYVKTDLEKLLRYSKQVQ